MLTVCVCPSRSVQTAAATVTKANDAVAPHLNAAQEAAAPYLQKAQDLAAPYIQKVSTISGAEDRDVSLRDPVRELTPRRVCCSRTFSRARTCSPRPRPRPIRPWETQATGLPTQR